MVDMTTDILEQWLNRRPFEPFRVVSSSGQTYEVRHPEMAILIRNGLVIAYGETDGLLEHAAVLSLIHIAAVETPQAA